MRRGLNSGLISILCASTILGNCFLNSGCKKQEGEPRQEKSPIAIKVDSKTNERTSNQQEPQKLKEVNEEVEYYEENPFSKKTFNILGVTCRGYSGIRVSYPEETVNTLDLRTMNMTVYEDSQEVPALEVLPSSRSYIVTSAPLEKTRITANSPNKTIEPITSQLDIRRFREIIRGDPEYNGWAEGSLYAYQFFNWEKLSKEEEKKHNTKLGVSVKTEMRFSYGSKFPLPELTIAMIHQIEFKKQDKKTIYTCFQQKAATPYVPEIVGDWMSYDGRTIFKIRRNLLTRNEEEEDYVLRGNTIFLERSPKCTEKLVFRVNKENTTMQYVTEKQTEELRQVKKLETPPLD